MLRAIRGSGLATAAVTLFVLFAPVVQAAPGGNPGGGEDFDPGNDSEGNHCLAPSGRDWNDLLQVSEQILRCPDVDSGEFLIPAGGWATNTSFEVVPAGFTPPPDKTPMEDFLGKLVSVTYVVDPGTRREKSYVYSRPFVSMIRFGDVFEGLIPPEWDDFPFAIVVSKLPPQPVGEHTVADIRNHERRSL